jgi:hypothetical protein
MAPRAIRQTSDLARDADEAECYKIRTLNVCMLVSGRQPGGVGYHFHSSMKFGNRLLFFPADEFEAAH